MAAKRALDFYLYSQLRRGNKESRNFIVIGLVILCACIAGLFSPACSNEIKIKQRLA